MSNTIFTGDIGTVIQLDVGDDVDATAADSVAIKFLKPNRVAGSWTATASTQYVQYTLQSGDVDVPGVWTFQSYVAGLGGWTGHGDKVQQTVEAPINA